MPKEITFKTTAEDFELIAKIADRVQQLEALHRDREDRRDLMSIVMDFCALQNSSTPVDLQRLLEADDGNFAHDAFGIARHLDRDTGELTDCFLPRFTKKSALAD